MFDDGAVEVYCDDHLVVCWVGQYLHKVTSEGAGRDYDDAADVHHDALVACALDFHECTLKAVELASVDTYSRALGEIDFVGTEEEDAFGCRAGHLDEVVHVVVADDDWLLLAFSGRDIDVS